MTYSIESMDDGDVETLVQYGIPFWAMTPYCKEFKYNPDCVRNLVINLADNHYLRVVKQEGRILGMIGFILSPLVFNDEVIVATEVFFFIHPSTRGCGLGEMMLERALKDLEPIVDIVAMGDMATSMDMEELYQRKGFSLSERTYTKVL